MGVLDYSGVPHVGGAEVAYLLEHIGCDIIEFAASVASYVPVGHTVFACVCKQARNHLVDYGFPDFGQPRCFCMCHVII